MKKGLILIITSLVLVVSGCSDKEEEKYGVEALTVLEENIGYANAQDVDGYLKAIREEEHEMTRGAIEESFSLGRITFEIVESDIIHADEDRVEIEVKQTTVAEDPIEGFQDNVLELLYTLKLGNDGKWKIFETEVLAQGVYEK